MSETSHPSITCNNCGINYIVAVADAAICPNCGTVHPSKGKYAKTKNELDSQSSRFGLLSFKIEQTSEGVLISWRRVSPILMFPLALAVLLLFSVYTVAPILIVIGKFVNDVTVMRGIMLIVFIGFIVLSGYISLLRERIIITDSEIIFSRQIMSQTRIPLHIVEDVIVQNLAAANPRIREAYRIILKTYDGDQFVAQMKQQAAAALIAKRIKGIAQVNTHRLTIPLNADAPKTKHAYQAPEKPPYHVVIRSDGDVIDYSWELSANTLSTFLSGASLSAWILILMGAYAIAVSNSRLQAQIIGAIMVSAGLILIYQTIRPWLYNLKAIKHIRLDTKMLTSYRDSLRQSKQHIASDSIEQIYVAREQVPYKRGKRTFYHYQYPLMAISTESPTAIKIGDFDDLNTARWIECNIENFLGIENLPTPQEYHQTE